jgi:hypothetical protein
LKTGITNERGNMSDRNWTPEEAAAEYAKLGPVINDGGLGVFDAGGSAVVVLADDFNVLADPSAIVLFVSAGDRESTIDWDDPVDGRFSVRGTPDGSFTWFAKASMHFEQG